MSDTSPRNQGALQHNSTLPPARQPKPGEEVWRLRDSTGRVQFCELRNNARAGAGWGVMLLDRLTRHPANKERITLFQPLTGPLQHR